MTPLVSSKIGRRVGVTIGLAMAIFGVGGLLLILAQTVRARERNTEQQLRTLAMSIVTSYAVFDARLGRHPAADILAELESREEIAELDLLGPTGIIETSIDPRRKGQKLPEEEQSLVESAARPPHVLVPLRKTSNCLPCHDKSPDPIGAIHLSSNTEYLTRGLVSFAWQASLATLLVVLILTGILMFLLHRMIIAPLSALTEVVSKAEEGDFFVRAEVKRRDEIGVLATSFNKLIAKITDLRVERIDSEREYLSRSGIERREK